MNKFPKCSAALTVLFTYIAKSIFSIAQRSCGCPLPARVQGQVGWSSEQPGLVEDVPAYGRGFVTR